MPDLPALPSVHRSAAIGVISTRAERARPRTSRRSRRHVVGALAGASAGEAAIPPEWLAIADAPRTLGWIRALAARLRDRSSPLRLWWPVVPVRNALFLAIVLATGMPRLLPPYGRDRQS